MTTSSIHHRPASFVAAAVALAAIAAGSLAFSLSHPADHPSAPGQQSQKVATPSHHDFHYQPSTDGGHVMPGL